MNQTTNGGVSLCATFLWVASSLAACAAEEVPSPDSGVSDTVGDTRLPSPPTEFTAVDHVAPTTYDRLLIEVDYVSGKEPAANALATLQSELDGLIAGGYLGKTNVRIVVDEAVQGVGGDNVSSYEALKAMSRTYRSVPVEAGESAIYILYVDGRYEDDDGQSMVLGFAYGGSWMVMLKDNIARACDSSSALNLPLLAGMRDQACARAEATVLLHELGHLFGLVNNGIAMQTPHQDEEHGAHDSNEDCLMYWTIQGVSAVDSVAARWANGDRSVIPFDAQCLADLKAVASP